MQTGKASAAQITQAFLDRIKKLDRSGPLLNSVIELNPDALSIARERDEERKQGKVRGPLHGIPILIKDNIDTGDQMMTTAGSLALEGNKAGQDAFIIAKLRLSGAVILGKTNLSEFANFRSTRSSSGWSSRGGQTRNPYILDRNPCGSSSGSGTAVAASLCAIAIGSETNGSIACPSSINGIVGIKPTVGLWSRSGIIPISQTQDTAGPMARTVRDAALLLGACTGEDTADKRTEESKGKALTDYTPFLKADSLKGKRIGIDKDALKGNEEAAALFTKAMEIMKAQGATFVEIDFNSSFKNMGKGEHTVLTYEFKDGLNRYLATSKAKVKSLTEVIAFNKANKDRVMPYFKQELLVESDALKGLDTKEYQDALANILRITRTAIDEAHEQHQLDALLSPGDGPSWCTDWVNGDAFAGNSYYWPAAIAGYPHITVPMGFVHGLPVGLHFIGQAWTEGSLISLAYAYEQASSERKAPEFKTTLGS
jgi:amidase